MNPFSSSKLQITDGAQSMENTRVAGTVHFHEQYVLLAIHKQSQIFIVRNSSGRCILSHQEIPAAIAAPATAGDAVANEEPLPPVQQGNLIWQSRFAHESGGAGKAGVIGD